MKRDRYSYKLIKKFDFKKDETRFDFVLDTVGREKLAQWLQKLCPSATHVLHLSFQDNYKPDLLEAQKRLLRLWELGNRECLGARWEELPNQQFAFAGVLAKPQSNLHAHLLLRLTPETSAFPERSGRLWRRISDNNFEAQISSLDSDYDRVRVADYLCLPRNYDQWESEIVISPNAVSEPQPIGHTSGNINFSESYNGTEPVLDI